jgi:tRNA pseudouridine38-40 synthase
VHALGQVAHLKFRKAPVRPPESIVRELNDRLPSSIAIVDAVTAPPDFHARHDAISRTYFYQISTRKTALAKRYVWWIKESLDIQAMQEAAALIPGRHDFNAFRAPDPSKPDESSIVVVNAAEIVEDEHLVVFRIEASHYLWKMVRRLTGVLVKIGKGELTAGDFRTLLQRKPGRRADVAGNEIAAHDVGAHDIAAWTAPAAGLFLESVKYR